MLIHQHLMMSKPCVLKRTLIVARFQAVLRHNFNVDIKTHVVASALNRISVILISLQTIDWYDSKARLMAHRIAFSDFRNTLLKCEYLIIK